MVKDKNSLELCFNNIVEVCVKLNFFSDPNIEKNLADLGDECGIVEMYYHDIRGICENILENSLDEWQDLLGEKGLQIIQELFSVIGESMQAYCCITMDYAHYQSGFSEGVYWLVFVEDIQKINIFLKDILRKHGRALAAE